VFTNTIKNLLQTVDGALAPTRDRLLSIRNVFGMHVMPEVAQQTPDNEQDLMITSNSKEIDLRKISFPDLVKGSICGEDGTIQPKHCMGSGAQNTITMDVVENRCGLCEWQGDAEYLPCPSCGQSYLELDFDVAEIQVPVTP